MYLELQNLRIAIVKLAKSNSFDSPISLLTCSANPSMAEFFRHLRCSHPLNPLVRVHPLNEPLMHHQDVGSSRDLRMDADGKDKCVIVLIAPGEHVLPCSLHAVRINVSMLVQIVNTTSYQWNIVLTAFGLAPSHWNGGQSSNVQFAGISTISDFSACFMGTIHSSGCFE